MATPGAVVLPRFYRFVFLWLEPVSIVMGAVAASFFPTAYLDLTHRASSPGHQALPTSTRIVMTQLGNLYLGLALLEAAVLRATADLKVWRTFLFVLLVADLGHLYSVHDLGYQIYLPSSHWNPIHLGNVPFVYFLAITRICILSGVGCTKEIMLVKKTA